MILLIIIVSHTWMPALDASGPIASFHALLAVCRRLLVA